ncbi:MAG: imidazole glycerol phosphate synthase subunit HisF [Spirochaetaceae bacterium]|jgi:cyclase|nr:imidazole glycerol phosphate synthase subunit HisF [Spirochaetaceae bacterium]
MQAKRIIPCLDVDDGLVKKGKHFTDLQEVGDPVELAERYNREGADELSFLDIGASYKSRTTLLEVVKQVAEEVFIPLCVGGGIRSVEDMRSAMNAGADKVSVCSAALQNPALLSEMAKTYGSQCVVLSIDAKRIGEDKLGKPVWHAFSHGGRIDTGWNAVEWAVEGASLGAGEILLNSIDADGSGEGYDIALIRRVIETVSVPVIASGGAGSLEQIAEVLLPPGAVPDNRWGNADAALVASLLHFGKTTIPEIKKYAESRGVCVRW